MFKMLQLKQSMTSQHEADNVLNGISDFAISWKMIRKLLMCHTALGSTFLTKKYPGQRCVPCWGCWMIRPHQLWYTSPTPSDKSEHPTHFHCLHVHPALSLIQVYLPHPDSTTPVLCPIVSKMLLQKKIKKEKKQRKKWEFPETTKWNWNRTFAFSKVLVVILNYYYDSTQRRKGDRKYWSKVTKDLSTCVSQPVLTQPSCFMCASIAY